MYSIVGDKTKMKSRSQKGSENGKEEKNPCLLDLQKIRVMGTNCPKIEILGYVNVMATSSTAA